MSNRGDIKKALKENGYKLVRTGKHFVYADAQGHEVQVHLGDTMRKQQLRGLLGSITKGNVKSGKRPTEKKQEAPLNWLKMDAQHYVLRRGETLTGIECRQRDIFKDGEMYKGWEVFRANEIQGGEFHGTLYGAKQVGEGLISGGA